MSSTKVKDRKGPHLDFYETPVRALDSLFSVVRIDGPRAVLEPSAGKGAIVRYLKAKHPGLHITGVEIQPQFEPDLRAVCDAVVLADFLTAPMTRKFALVVANPPFSQAQQFIERALALLLEGGKAAFLLRLPFVAGVKRFEFFQRHRPAHVLVLSQRPKFGGDNIDSCDYAWVVWNDSSAAMTEMRWLPPMEARRG